MKKLYTSLLIIFTTTLSHNPSYYFNLGKKLADQRKFEEAIYYFERAHDLDPDNHSYFFRIAYAYHIQRKYAKACPYYEALLNKLPNHSTLLCNAHLVYSSLGKFDKAIECLEKILIQQPTNRDIQKKLGIHYLRKQQWEKAQEIFGNPFWWYNTDIKNNTILIKHWGGFGDVINFVRYAKHLHDSGATVYVQTREPLMQLLRLCPYIDKLIPLIGQLPKTDKKYEIFMGHLILAMRDTFNKPSQDVPYIYADPNLILYWKKELEHNTNFKVGLCWSTSPTKDLLGNQICGSRGIALEKFTPLFHFPDISFYSLQKIDGTEDIASLPKNVILHNFGADFDESHGRFMDTAAVMKNLDLVITVDTSIAHLAGALGVPVWMMIPTCSCFRWFSDRSDSPWYPTMRLFRQKEFGNWDDVITKVKQALRNFFNNKAK